MAFPLLIIAGTTASGKTDAAEKIADAVPSHLISADTVQIYQGFDIGSGKPDKKSLSRYTYSFINSHAPTESLSAGAFAVEAEKIIYQNWQKGIMPIVVGGAGLYIRTLLQGISPIPMIPANISAIVRAKDFLTEEAKRRELIHRVLTHIDPEWAQSIKNQDKQRLLRGWEVFLATGHSIRHFFIERIGLLQKYPVKLHYWKIILAKEIINANILARTQRMVEQGLVDEVRGLLNQGISVNSMPMKSVGYKETIQFLQGNISQRDIIPAIAQATRAYAKRQRTWFRREPGITVRSQSRLNALQAVFIERYKIRGAGIQKGHLQCF